MGSTLLPGASATGHSPLATRHSGDRTIPGSNVPPTAGELAVYDELAIFHRSARYPLPLKSIHRRTGMREREIKAAVEGLRVRHGVPVGACRGKLCGYFLVTSAEDEALMLKAYRRQFITEARVVRGMLRHNKRRFLEFWDQLALDIFKEEPRSG